MSKTSTLTNYIYNGIFLDKDCQVKPELQNKDAISRKKFIHNVLNIYNKEHNTMYIISDIFRMYEHEGELHIIFNNGQTFKDKTI